MKQMGFMDKLLDVMRLNEDDYEFDNDEYEFEDDYEEEEVKEKKPSRKERKEEQQAKRNETNFDMSERRQKNVEKPAKKVSQKVTPIRSVKRAPGPGMEVCVIKPNAIEDELEITETLLNGRTVVINMEGLNVEIAQRIIDFTSGATFAMHGNLQKISNYIFLATPNGVDISGDIQNLMDSFDLPGFTV